jgi:hypothetical protein
MMIAEHFGFKIFANSQQGCQIFSNQKQQLG